MAKAIYGIKIFPFQQQFTLTAKEKNSVTELALFVSLVYISYWHEGPLPIKALLNDLLLLDECVKYPNVTVPKTALTTFKRHLWYLSEILFGLSLFDERIEFVVKTKMVANFQSPQHIICLKRLDRPPETLAPLGLASCITCRTTDISDVLAVKGEEKAQSFLPKDVDEWSENASFQELKTSALAVMVVNDSAEKAIALMERYNCTLTKNEEQKQLLLHLVRQHRETYPTSSKATLMKETE